MPKRQVFFSFKYKDDFDRVNLVRNMGAIEGDSIVSDNEWEEIKRTPDGIKKWIKKQMEYRSCIVVCIGADTSNRYYCNYEIEYAWKAGKGIVGVYIHNLNNLDSNKSPKGNNPFDNFTLTVNGKEMPMSQIVKTYDPFISQNKNNPNQSSYNDIHDKLEDLIEEAIALREKYGNDITIKEEKAKPVNNSRVEITNPPKQWI